MHEPVLLPYIFGCDSEDDDLCHYLTCDPLWTLAASASSLPIDFLSLSSLERPCLLNKSIHGLRLSSVVYSYHALRLGHGKLVEYCIRTCDFEEIILLAMRIFAGLWRN